MELSSATLGFHEISDGAVLGLGSANVVRSAVGVGAMFAFLAVPLLLVTQILQTDGSTVIPLTVELAALAVVTVGVGVVYSGIRQRGVWALAVDDAGFHLLRGHAGVKDFPWSSVARIRYGAVPVQRGRYQVALADGLRIDGRRSGDGFFLHTVRFHVTSDDIDRMATVTREVASRHAVVAEPFPMVGRAGS